MPADVPVPVRDQIVRDSEEPGRKRHPLNLIAMQVIHRLEERSGGQILGVGGTPGSVIDVVIDATDVTLIKNSEGLSIITSPNGQNFIRLMILH